MHDTHVPHSRVICRTRMNSVEKIVLARYAALRIGGRAFHLFRPTVFSAGQFRLFRLCGRDCLEFVRLSDNSGCES